ncbi:MAG: ABC-2 family transporter protein [Candidatus Hydrogenedentes bacterium]|nr:ABC-2 family transporter protein [Candidatus Hydrogenedentota bacterium]
MRPYWAMLSARFRTLLQYRAAALAGFGTQLFFGVVIVMTYQAFYSANTTPQPMSLEHVVSYIWLGQALFALMPWAPDADIRLLIRTGGVAYELLRPVNVYWLWFSRALARRTAPTVLRSIPMFITAMLLLGLQPPASLASGLAWGMATVCAVLLASAIATIFGIGMIWTISGEGLHRLVSPLVMLLSGMLIPLPLMPAWSQTFLRVLPFRGLADIPFRLYLGDIPPSSVGPMLLHQLTWVALLALFGHWLLSRAMRRLVVQGG